MQPIVAEFEAIIPFVTQLTGQLEEMDKASDPLVPGKPLSPWDGSVPIVTTENYCGSCGRIWGGCVCPNGPSLPSPGSMKLLTATIVAV